MGYAPSAIARAMSTRRTHTVGLVVTTIADPFVADENSKWRVASHPIEDIALDVVLAQSRNGLVLRSLIAEELPDRVVSELGHSSPLE